MRKNIRRNILGLLAAGLMLWAAGANAAFMAVTPASGGSQNSRWNGYTTIGWQFSLSSAIRVTNLGFYDANGNGLAEAHEVGIWTSAGILQGSAEVTSGTSAALLNGFRFVDVSPFELGPGNYVIGAFGSMNSTDAFRFGMSGSTTMPGLTLGYAVQSTQSASPDTVLEFPHQLRFTEGYFGPNFLAEPASTVSVPEPGTFALLGLGLVGMGMRRRIKAS